MMKKCWFDAHGVLIHIGEWDTQPEQIEVRPAQYDEDGNMIADTVYETVERNPIPHGAYSEERAVEQDEDGGWHVVGQPRPITLQERLKAAEDMMLEILLGGV